MNQNYRVDDQIKEIFDKEGISWAKVAVQTQNISRASIRRNLIGWLEKANKVLNAIGYRVAIVPIKEDEENINK